MQQYISKLQASFPHLKFTAGSQFYWSPETQEIFYNIAADGQKSVWSLLHETGHALLGHATYKADMELLRLEVGLQINEEHIQDCLDTYRDWLYKRSICPSCNTKCLQQGDFVHYRCFNCHTTWRVSSNRFVRTYRRTKESGTLVKFL
jgi:hypothetical protein